MWSDMNLGAKIPTMEMIENELEVRVFCCTHHDLAQPQPQLVSPSSHSLFSPLSSLL